MVNHDCKKTVFLRLPPSLRNHSSLLWLPPCTNLAFFLTLFKRGGWGGLCVCGQANMLKKTAEFVKAYWHIKGLLYPCSVIDEGLIGGSGEAGSPSCSLWTAGRQIHSQGKISSLLVDKGNTSKI